MTLASKAPSTKMSISTEDIGGHAIADHEISSPESDVEFALPPDSDYSSAESTASTSRAERVSRVAMYPKHRPPPLKHQRSFSVEPRLSRPDSEIGRPIISSSSRVSSNDLKSLGSAGRESFIDLDDMMSPTETGSPGSLEFNPNTMYPTPTRSRFKRSSHADSLRSTASQLPTFAMPGRDPAGYQPIYEPRRLKNRPQSMLVSPNFASFFEDDDHRSPGSLPPPSSSGKKPPIPKVPKPPQLLRKAAASSSAGSSPKDKTSHTLPPPPPTTNNLDHASRQELLRKNRKLAQMFGENVGGMLWPCDDPHAEVPVPRGVVAPKHHKASRSASALASPVQEESFSQVLVIGPKRRYSTPSSAEFDMARSRTSSETLTADDLLGSPESFMDFDDHEGGEHDVGKDADTASINTLSTQNTEALAEAERKKMRDKLAKLHRFLGSRVPVELALGAGYVLDDRDLPEVQAAEREGDKIKRRRRSSSSAALPGYDDLSKEDRMKDSMDDKERAMQVKRANKMEQVFGARPPVTLYQNRPARPGSPAAPGPSSSGMQRPPLPDGFLPPTEFTRESVDRPTTFSSNVNNSAYQGKARYSYKSYGKRPGTAESAQGLLSDAESSQQNMPGVSAAYMYWRNSLISLKDIIDNHDKESLAELHHLMHSPDSSDSEDEEDNAATPTMSSTNSRAAARYSSSTGSTVSLERRRSLPARTSMISLVSTTSSIASVTPDPDGFQQRRKRAAKLTNFFGVNYRDLFGDVLDSIERGMNEEVVAGRMKAAEVEELMNKLRKLKIRRDVFS